MALPHCSLSSTSQPVALCPLLAWPLLPTLLEVPSLGRQGLGLSGEKVKPFVIHPGARMVIILRRRGEGHLTTPTHPHSLFCQLSSPGPDPHPTNRNSLTEAQEQLGQTSP